MLVVALVAVVACAVRAIGFTPIEAVQGPAQKIFYIHVPAAWCAFLAFGLVGICSGLYLWLGDRRLDLFSEASVEVGVLLTAMVLVSGPLWGKPVWGAWWQWEPRLTSTLFLFFLMVGYLSLRSAVLEPELRARYSAVVGILGALLVPFIHMTVYMFRTIHPKPVVLKPDGPTASSEMLVTLLASFAAWTFFYVALVTTRYALGRVAAARDA
ncbi:MAG: cytochrome c biogenesis protein CcsA [Gemmatimonadales bacterium]|nr:cytochrome c biogenesis protein CcsA [Gemmatimonadales bacterium]